MIDKVQKIKEARMTSEERYFLGLFRIMKEIKLEMFPNSIFYLVNKKIIFEKNDNTKTINVSEKLLLKIKSKYNNSSMIAFVSSLKIYLNINDYCHFLNNNDRFNIIESYINIHNFKNIIYDERENTENKIE
jgi:hypothetical protein